MSESNLAKLERQRKEKELEIAKEKETFSYDKLEVVSNYKAEMIQVMHKTVAKGTSPAELAYFLTVAKESGLNPFNKEIWCYKDGNGNLIVFAGRDGFLKRAQQDERWAGMRSCEVCENDTFEMNPIEGTIKHIFGAKDRGNLIGAYAIVFVKGIEPTIEWVNYKEFDLKQALWKSKPAMMIKKVAETHALKKAFGINGISSEYDFKVNSAGTVVTEDADVTEMTQEEIESDRLIKLIDAADTKEKLQKLLKECKTSEEVEAYDTKLKSFS